MTIESDNTDTGEHNANMDGKDTIEALLQWSEESDAKNRRGLKQQIAAAKLEHPEKATFDYVEFMREYGNRIFPDITIDPSLSTEAQDDFERLYYLRYPDAKTMREFALALEKTEAKGEN